MSTQRYQAFANLFMAVAVCSALGFDHAGKFAWLVGSLGAVAAFGSAALYFSRQWTAREAQQQEHQDKQPQNPIEAQIVRLAAGSTSLNINCEVKPSVDVAYFTELKYSGHGYTRFYLDDALFIGPFAASPQIRFADEVVEIVNRLAPTCDFDLSRDGTLRIRPRHEGDDELTEGPYKTPGLTSETIN